MAEAAAVHEGKERGEEIASQQDFMTVIIESAAGQSALLQKAMAAANEALPPSTEDGSKRPGKMLVSHGANSLCLMCHVPEEHHTTATAEDWMKAVLSRTGGILGPCSATEAQAELVRSDGTLPFELPDGTKVDKAETVGFEATKKSVEWLRERGLFPPKEEEDDDDWEAAGDVEW